jgi:hypothetical protein
MIWLQVAFIFLVVLPTVPSYAQALGSIQTDAMHYEATLKQFVSSSGVNYAALQQDRTHLDLYVQSLSRVSGQTYDEMNAADKIAFWLNTYNAITLRVIVDHYPIQKRGGIMGLRFPAASIRQIPGVWKKPWHQVMRKDRTLEEIEHEILRRQFREPRIHLALVCAARGCPPLRREPYRGGDLNKQLDDQAKHFLVSKEKFRIDRAKRVVFFSSIFKWFGKDFSRKYSTDGIQANVSKNERAVINFAMPYLSSDDARFLRDENYQVKYIKYDWTLNESVEKGER